MSESVAWAILPLACSITIRVLSAVLSWVLRVWASIEIWCWMMADGDGRDVSERLRGGDIRLLKRAGIAAQQVERADDAATEPQGERGGSVEPLGGSQGGEAGPASPAAARSKLTTCLPVR